MSVTARSDQCFHAGKAKTRTLDSRDGRRVRKVALDSHLNIRELGERDRREDIVIHALLEQNGRVRRVVARCERGSQGRRIVRAVSVGHDECVPRRRGRREEREGEQTERGVHGQCRARRAGAWRTVCR